MAVFFVAIFMCEVYLRYKGHRLYIITFPGQYQHNHTTPKRSQLHPLLGWTAIPRPPEINPQGFRDTKDFNKVNLNSGKIRVMILGDSFVYGGGVRADENVSNFLQKRLNEEYEVFNLGMLGWGIDQMYLAYQLYKDVIRPDIVILAYIDDDVNRVLQAYRNEGLSKPSFEIKNGKLIQRTTGSKVQQFLNAVTGRSAFFSTLFRYVYVMKDARPIVKKILLDMAEDTQQRNEKFVVIRIPMKYYYTFDPIYKYLRGFKDVLRGTDTLYLEPFEEIRKVPNWSAEFYLNDAGGHLSLKGNQFLADYIYRHVFEKST
jgi:hypothetical protein